ncbi:hypothetical protein KM043_006301 [Ampulex compressa]|nr:hypothetical protein KM043_006301 [Ampulex compressa]
MRRPGGEARPEEVASGRRAAGGGGCRGSAPARPSPSTHRVHGGQPYSRGGSAGSGGGEGGCLRWNYPLTTARYHSIGHPSRTVLCAEFSSTPIETSRWSSGRFLADSQSNVAPARPFQQEISGG